ncbi:hypothetical protein BSNK01_28490 [Bacillaceae bacterium]
MLRDLQRYLANGTPVDIIYLDRAGRFSKRRLRLLEIVGNHIRAYCYTRRAPRTFAISNILAVQPVMGRAG